MATTATGRRALGPDNDVSRLLFIDAYDSYSNNIITLLRRVTRSTVTTIKIDDSRFLDEDSHVFEAFLRHFQAVVIGPGPGDPHLPKDTGLINRLWSLPEHSILPVLGVCLGFQSLVLTHGGSVVRLHSPRHGIVTAISHHGTSIFQNLGVVHATQYHSLHARLGHDLTSPDADHIWQRTACAPLLQPLAWDLSDPRNGPVLMGVAHVVKPFYAVQYHPESIRTNCEGARVVENWWAEVRCWRAAHYSSPTPRGVSAQSRGTDSGYGTDDEALSPAATAGTRSLQGRAASSTKPSHPARTVAWTRLDLAPSADLMPSLIEYLERTTSCTPVLLESGCKHGQPVRSETGRFSIVGAVERDSEHFRYWTDGRFEHVHGVGESEGDVLCSSGTADIRETLDLLRTNLAGREAVGGPVDVPFWGGLVGYISYEAGLESIDVSTTTDIGWHEADAHFVAVERSIVIDHCEDKVYVQSLRHNDHAWLDSMEKCIAGYGYHVSSEALSTNSLECRVDYPNEAGYCSKVEACQAHIRAGDSYELCLTDTSPITFSSTVDAPSIWDLYRRLRKNNPAPFGAFMSFDDVAIASSSPERFLSWSRDGTCEFRPIKGTVQKESVASREEAEAILMTDKEQAENLMIVDLIRHDLNGVLGETDMEADVPKLMQVEEYETVYQLVSVIRGDLSQNAASPALDKTTALDMAMSGRACTSSRDIDDQPRRPQGIDVLLASLPPGSMTGAPKKRSCELLCDIERRRRGLYSGVLGYLDVGGGGDFSVVIRSIVRDQSGYHISAGGAVTALSEPAAEWAEMMGKSQAVQI